MTSYNITSLTDENYFIKDSEILEFVIHDYIYKLTESCRDIINMPRVFNFDEKTKKIIMEKIPYMNISDFYGENWSDIPKWIQCEIKKIIKTLFFKGIIYPDITGYNFIEFDKKIWIIDFEHVFIYNISYDNMNPNQKIHYDFVQKFISDENCGWNPWFK
jgi:hypothetical protein